MADAASPLADDTIGPAAVFELAEPISIAIFHDPSSRDELIERLAALASPTATKLVRSGEEALACARDEALVLVDPSNPAATVTFFDRNRDHFTLGPARFVLLLMRGGSGERALQDATSLSSFARDASFEVGRSPSIAELEKTFEATHGKSFTDWLAEWRSGALPDTLENNHILSEALSLEEGRP